MPLVAAIMSNIYWVMVLKGVLGRHDCEETGSLLHKWSKYA